MKKDLLLVCSFNCPRLSNTLVLSEEVEHE
uniref:Uncharacterized protein n=1 Tax=Setaria italica TaxID=4555 RepID=K3XU78_SETIT